MFDHVRFLRQAWRASPAWSSCAIALVALQAIVGAGFMLFSGRLVAHLAGGEQVTSTDIGLVGGLLSVTLVLPTVTEIVSAQWTRHQVSQQYLHAADLLFAQAQQSPAGEVKRRVGDVVHSWDTRHSVGAIVQWLIVRSSGVGGAVVLALWNPWWTLVALLVLGIGETRRTSFPTQRDDPADERRWNIDAVNSVDPEVGGEIRIHGLGRWYVRALESTATRMADARQLWHRRRLVFETRSTALSTVAYAILVAALAGDLVTDGVSAAVVAGLQAVARLNGFGALPGVDRVLRRQRDLSDELADLTTSPRAVPQLAINQQGVETGMAAVTFGYGNTEVLHEVTLGIPGGRVTALVGLNGAGKSTVAHLLSGELRAEPGHVSVAGCDPAQAHRQGAVVVMDQQPVRLPGTVAENVFPWEPNHSPCLVCDGLQLANLDDARDELELSVGQWQRIVLARCLHAALRPGVRLLILDEPTSALDVGMERRLVRLLAEIVAQADDLAVLLISHRFSTVRLADDIAVLDHGAIIERGDHARLIVGDGLYARMYRAQVDRLPTC